LKAEGIISASEVNMRILITGAGGRLGGSIRGELASAGHSVTAPGRADLDITSAEQIGTAIAQLCPDAIVNCSAYNDVDRAESNQAVAFAINAVGPSLLADAAEAAGVVLVHYGSDFVFDGTALEPYSEEAVPNPLNVYGASKLSGESEVRRSRRHYILRVESLFGGSGARGHRATVDWIAGRLLAGAVVHAVVDRTVSPSYVCDVARATRMLLEHQAPFGTYHCVNSGFSTWYELAQEIARGLGIPARIEPITAVDLTAIASRPRFCALSNRKLHAVGVDMPSWESAIRRHLVAAAQTDVQAGAA
jgi:dTDP-4-dehydrorhamnose reductase